MGWRGLSKCTGIVVLMVTTLAGASAQQDSYFELKGALQGLTKLSETIVLDGGPFYDARTNQNLASGGTLFKIADVPAWHATGTYGWTVNDMVSLETELSFGQRTFNDIEYTPKVASTINGVSIVHWYDTDGDNKLDSGELTKVTTPQGSDYISAMLNALYTAELSDEFDLGMGIGGGFIYAHYTDGIDGASAVLPGYQLKTKLRFQANDSTYYMVEAGFQAGLSGDLTETSYNTRNAGDGAGKYNISYSHFWTGVGVGYKF